VCCSVLQCVAVCCSVYSVLRCVAVCYSMWQCIAVCCRVLHCHSLAINMYFYEHAYIYVLKMLCTYSNSYICICIYVFPDYVLIRICTHICTQNIMFKFLYMYMYVCFFWKYTYMNMQTYLYSTWLCIHTCNQITNMHTDIYEFEYVHSSCWVHVCMHVRISTYSGKTYIHIHI